MSNPNSFGPNNDNMNPDDGPWGKAYQESMPPFRAPLEEEQREFYSDEHRVICEMPELLTGQSESFYETSSMPLMILSAVKKACEENGNHKTEKVIDFIEKASTGEYMNESYYRPEYFEKILGVIDNDFDTQRDLYLYEERLDNNADDEEIAEIDKRYQMLQKMFNTVVYRCRTDEDGYRESLHGAATRIYLEKAAWCLKQCPSGNFHLDMPEERFEQFNLEFSALNEIIATSKWAVQNTPA